MTTIDNGYGKRMPWRASDWEVYDMNGARIHGEPTPRLVEESLQVIGGRVPIEIRTLCGRTTLAFATDGTSLFGFALRKYLTDADTASP